MRNNDVAPMTTDYNNEDYQRNLINFMISDPLSFTRAQNIVKEEYFTDTLRPAIRYLKEYSEKYKQLPLPEQIKAETGLETVLIADAPNRAQWFLDQTQAFCKYRAIENVVLDGYDLIQKGMEGDLERRLKDALTISLVSDLGSNVYEDVKGKLLAMKDKSNYVSTGWDTIDRKLYGGFTRGSLNFFAGGSGSGKSLFLQNIAINWSLMGLNVVYITLELSEDLTNMRLYSMLSDVHSKEIMKRIDEVAMKIAINKKNARAGELYVKKLPEAGTTSNDIRAYLKEFEIKTGKKCDALVVDYLDLMHPNNGRIDVSNLFTKDKYVSEELRAIGGEWDIPVATASQLNRSAVDAIEFDHSHIAGGISKINTADNVFGIYTSMTKRENGIYEIQYVKTRSAAAVGMKSELAFCPNSLRITDLVDAETGEIGPEVDNRFSGAAAVRMAAEEAPTPIANIRTGLNEMLTQFKKRE